MKKGKWITGLVMLLMVITGCVSGNVMAIETRPTIPASAPGDDSTPDEGSSQIVYELAPGFEVQEALDRRANGAKRMNVIGMASWGCIGAGMLVVVIVVISGSRRRVGTIGVKRTRYRRETEVETRARRYMDDNRYRKY